MSGARLVALRCTACQTPLVARPADRLCLCSKCATAIEVTPAGLVAYPVTFGGGSGAYTLWWRLEGEVAIPKFSATRPAQTPFGTVDAGRTLPAIFAIPAGAETIGACYRAALAERPAKVAKPSPRRADATVEPAHLLRVAAEQVARQVFLTHVARAEGQVRFLDFAVTIASASVLARGH